MTGIEPRNQSGIADDDQGETAPHFVQQLQEAEALVSDFRKLLVQHESSLISEGVCEHLETLEYWLESYRRGLKAATKISTQGAEWLREAQQRLRLASEELQRLDAESPAAPPRDIAKKSDDYARAAKRVEALIPAVEQTVTKTESIAS